MKNTIESIRNTYASEIESRHAEAVAELEKIVSEIIESRKAPDKKFLPMTDDQIRENAARKVHRFWYVKNVTIDGIEYDAEIDALTNDIKLLEI